MAFEDQDEEIEDADSDQKNNSDEEDDSDEDAEDDESEDGDDEGAEDDDDDESDSDEDAPLPKTRKELDAAIAKGVRDALKSKKNRDGADRRSSKRDQLPDRKRPGSAASRAEAERLDRIEARQAKAEEIETKRQYGYENSLSPDEVDVVFRLNKKPTAKTLRDPIVKGALQGHRDAKALRSNLPSSKGRVIPVGSKDYSKMSPADQSKHFTSRRQQILDSKRQRGG